MSEINLNKYKLLGRYSILQIMLTVGLSALVATAILQFG